jgi:hypothetical protein
MSERETMKTNYEHMTEWHSRRRMERRAHRIAVTAVSVTLIAAVMMYIVRLDTAVLAHLKAVLP